MDAAHAPARVHLTRGEDAGREAPSPGAVLRALPLASPLPLQPCGEAASPALSEEEEADAPTE